MKGQVVTPQDTSVPPELLALHQEAVDAGFKHGLDFLIQGIHSPMSSELIVLSRDGDDYVVDYQDMGRYTGRARSTSFEEIRTRFLAEVAALAGPRGRGPTAGQPVADPYEGWTYDQRLEEMRRRGFDV